MCTHFRRVVWSGRLDGIVCRDRNGKEKRYPVMLSALEKEWARKVVVAFQQTVCGLHGAMTLAT